MEMSFNGGFEVGIPRAEAFALLSDPEKFLPVLPMYHSMAKKESRREGSCRPSDSDPLTAPERR